MQTRLQFLIEAGTNILVGIVLAFLLNRWLLASFGQPISVRNNLVMTFVMTAASLARSYGLRRLFNRWHR